MVLSVSVPLKLTPNGLTYQPLLPSGRLLGVPCTPVGAVLSMLMSFTVFEVLLPARSWQLPVALCPASSAVFVTLTEVATGPDPPSAQVQFTVTLVLFQPLALATGR